MSARKHLDGVHPGPTSPKIEDDDYGMDIEFDKELETLLVEAESQAQMTGPSANAIAVDIEDAILEHVSSPFEQFRRKGWLSVSDLVGTIWCEVQYDYRLRTLPYLPPSQRPEVITSKEGVPIPVDKVKVEGKERILRRGEKIHKRLEREIHPEEIVVHAVTRVDVWGLRFLNMFSALEALLTLGKCRELPVVGFVRGILVMGIIDEITRRPIDEGSTKRTTRSSAPDKSQTSLTSFFSPTKPRPASARRERTHRLFVSDSKTRASGSLPKESDTLAGKFQVMLYKELLDALLLPPTSSLETNQSTSDKILPTETRFSWNGLFEHLGLSMDEELSEDFVLQSRPIIIGNGLRYDVGSARTLRGMVKCWISYAEALGLGTPEDSSTAKGNDRNTGKTEDRLELVYRRAGAKQKKSKENGAKAKRSTGRKSKRKGRRAEGADIPAPDEEVLETTEELQMQRAIEESFWTTKNLHEKPPQAISIDIATESARDVEHGAEAANSNAANDDATEEDELAWAVEMSLGAASQNLAAEEEGEVVLRGTQLSHVSSSSPVRESSPSSVPSTPSPPQSRSRSQTPQPQPQPTVETSQAELTEEVGSKGSGSGSIIGRSVFTHSPRRLAVHLASVLEWWMGERDAVGVSIEETRRCGWCEFEEGCEWRTRKAEEILEKARKAREGSISRTNI